MISIQEINKDNYIPCIKLKVKQDQKKFVATNTISLAQAYVFKDFARPFAILKGTKVVGFIMFEINKTEDEYSVWRFMVDKRYQGKGYGKEALKLGIDYLVQEGATIIKLSHVKGNEGTSKLYLNCGFTYNGELDGEELVMEYKVK
jgi:diamine N-acetyltransferase